jgi:hypothetical protein
METTSTDSLPYLFQDDLTKSIKHNPSNQGTSYSMGAVKVLTGGGLGYGAGELVSMANNYVTTNFTQVTDYAVQNIPSAVNYACQNISIENCSKAAYTLITEASDCLSSYVPYPVQWALAATGAVITLTVIVYNNQKTKRQTAATLKSMAQRDSVSDIISSEEFKKYGKFSTIDATKYNIPTAQQIKAGFKEEK